MQNGISTEQLNGLLEVTLDRPDRLNSFIDEMHIELRRALQHASTDPDCCSIIVGRAARMGSHCPTSSSSRQSVQKALS